jgi:hypothetical protein
VLTHRYAASRERRADLLKALDAMLAVLVRADREMTRLIGAIRDGLSRDAAMERAERVTQEEIAMRAAMFSLAIRLPANDTLVAKFFYTISTFGKVSRSITAAARTGDRERAQAFEAANQTMNEYKDGFSEAIDAARERMTPRRRPGKAH